MLKVLRGTLERLSTIGVWNNNNSTHKVTSALDALYSTSTECQGAAKFAIEDEIDLPKKPKKPLIPWLAFVRERRDSVLRHNENFKMADVTSLLSKEWKNMDKTKYEHEYQIRREEYLKQCEIYENSLTDQQREYRLLKKEIEREAKAHRKLQKLKPPKLPRNPGNLYCAEKYKQPEIKEQLKYRRLSEITKDLFNDYRSLSEDEKKIYIDMQQKDMLRFQKEFNEWYDCVMNNSELPKAVKDIANSMRDRFKTLKKI